MPFYGFGPLKITAVRNLGSLAPLEGPPTVVECPLRDSLRSVYPWFVLGGLLLLRRANRTRAAWAILLPLLAVYAAVYIVENTVGHRAFWYLTPTICSLICEMLRSLALGIAFLLAVADLIKVRSRFLRFILTSLVIFIAGGSAILLNTPFLLESHLWLIPFGVVLLIFRAGLSLIAALLRRFSRRHQLQWCAGVSLILGACSILILTGALLASHSAESLTTQQVLYYAAVAPQPFLTPYLVFFLFALPALLSPFYRRRFAHCLAGDSSPPQAI